MLGFSYLLLLMYFYGFNGVSVLRSQTASSTHPKISQEFSRDFSLSGNFAKAGYRRLPTSRRLETTVEEMGAIFISNLFGPGINYTVIGKLFASEMLLTIKCSLLHSGTVSANTVIKLFSAIS